MEVSWLKPSFCVPLFIAILSVIALVVPGQAQDATSVSAICGTDPVSVNATPSCTVTVINTAGGTPNGSPQGTVTVSVTAGPGNITNNTCTVAFTSTCTFDYTPSALGGGTHSFSLSYLSGNPTGSGWSNSSGTGSVVVNTRTTTTVVSGCPSPLAVNQAGACTVTITDTSATPTSSPQGTVALSSTGAGTFGACTLAPSGGDAASCSVDYTPTSALAGTHTIAATYTATGVSTNVHAGSSDAVGQAITVNARATTTSVSTCSAALALNQTSNCTIIVSDTGAGMATNPVGSIAPATTGNGTFGTCTLAPFGFNVSTCTVDYTPVTPLVVSHSITATYTPSGSSTDVHAGSSDAVSKTITVSARATTTVVVCTDPVAIDGMGSCTVTVTDAAGSGASNPAGTVALSDSVEAATPFSACTLANSGVDAATCTVDYSPTTTLGARDITTTYTASGPHADSDNTAALESVTVSKRPTTTVVSGCASPLFVNEPTTTCKVTVSDLGAGASDPAGTMSLTDSTGDGTFTTCTLAATATTGVVECTFTFTPTGSVAVPHAITASFTASGNHANSNDSAGVSITVNVRTTTTVVSSCPASLKVAQTGSCTVTVTDTANATKSNPVGTVALSTTGAGTFGTCALAPSGGDAASCTVNYTPASALLTTHGITASYTATGASAGIHANSADTSAENVTVNLRTTETLVTSCPAFLALGQTGTCTVRVKDIDSAGTKSIPQGTVTLAHSGTGTITGSPCTLAASGADEASCSVNYTPTSGTGTHTMTATVYDRSGTVSANVHETDTDPTGVGITVTLIATQTTVSCASPTFVNVGVTCTATVTNLATTVDPTGSVTLGIATGPGAFAGTCTLSGGGGGVSTCSDTYTPSASPAATHAISASYPATGDFGASSAATNASVAVNLQTTTTAVACASALAEGNGNVDTPEHVQCTVTVTNTTTLSDPLGTVSLSSNATSFITTVGTTTIITSCTLSSGNPATCNFDYEPGSTSAGLHTITATYVPSASTVHAVSSVAQPFVVTDSVSPTTTVVTCTTPLFVDQTGTCTITVTDTTGGANPEGTITMSDSTGNGTFTLCVLFNSGTNAATCIIPVNYTPTAASTHTITATYTPTTTPSQVHLDSFGTFDVTVNERTTGTTVVCVLDTIVIAQTTVCTATVLDIAIGDETVPSSPGLVTFDDGGKAGGFVASTCSLDPTGKCSVSYTPADGDAGTTTISAAYAGNSVHAGSSGNDALTVGLRATTTTFSCVNQIGTNEALLVDEIGTCTVVVTDVETVGTPSAPAIPTVTLSSVFASACGNVAASVTQSRCTFTYTRNSLSENVVVEIVTASYSASTTHAASNGVAGIAVLKRSTTASLTEASCPKSGLLFNFTATCTLSVVDISDPARGPALAAPTGSVLNALDDSVLCTPLGCSFTAPLTGLSNVISAKYSGDSKYIESFASVTIQLSIAEIFGAGGVIDVESLILGANITCVALASVSLVLNAVALPIGALPEPVLGLIAGTKISVADVVAAIISGAALVLDAAQLAVCSDIDGDGIPDEIERAIGTDPANWDTDNDGNGDLGEIDLALGKLDPGYSVPGNTTICPSPVFRDSDGDNLQDGDERGVWTTDFCKADTDEDGLDDGVEVGASFSNVFFVGGIPAGLVGTFPYDLKDRPNPREADTDGDGLRDDAEFAVGCSGVTDGFVNSADSDDDGLPDGAATEAFIDLGVPSSTGLLANDGELNTDTIASMCDPDSDDDGLNDGVEVGLGTDPRDWDSDDDGLTDREEVEIYGTDPRDTDTDNDGADGNITNRDPIVAPALAGYSGGGLIACLSDCEEALSFSTQGDFVGEPLDQTDPLMIDTDGDNINDLQEFVPGCSMGDDGFANSFDSDADGASDGKEFEFMPPGDVAASNGNNGELNDDTLASICDPDSDGDGLLDGAELGLNIINLAPTSDAGPSGATDWDSDNDGLSDREEVEIYFTSPDNPDTDGDLADGVIAARIPTFTDGGHPALAGHSGSGTIACLSDCEEAFSGTLLFNPAFSAVAGSPPAPGGATGFGNPLDETDPLQQDTDGDGINDNIEFAPGCNDGPGGPGTGTALFDGFANSFDSDADGLRDFEDAVADVFDGGPGNNDTPVSRTWQNYPETPRPAPGGAKVVGDGINDGEINDDAITGICDPDSDGDNILDGEEQQIGTDPYDHDSDDDGRGDGEFLGEGPIPSDPLDFDTDDDGLGDGVEVFGANPTNPVTADTDGDGLCDGGATTPASTQFAPAPGPGTVATGGVDGAGSNALCYAGVASHPNDGASANAVTPTPSGWGEDVNGDGTLAGSETNPNDFDTDNDAVGDGVEVLAFYTSRQTQIPATDLFGRAITVVYPKQDAFVCMNPLNPDSDGDGLSDGEEDVNADGIFNFERGDFDHAGQGPIPGPAQDNPEETNPCDPDSDDDGLNDFQERNQPNLPPGTTTAPQSFFPFNPTNPLDHDTDNDYLLDGAEVSFVCPAAPPVTKLDNDNDGLFDEDPIDGVDNDLDGKIDEDPPDFIIFHVDFLDPTNRDTDGDGFLDGLDPGGFGGPCNTAPIVVVPPLSTIEARADIDNDGFADDDEVAAGTDPNAPDSHPEPFFSDLDLDKHSVTLGETLIDTQGASDNGDDDRMWLDDQDRNGIAESVVIDLNADGLVDARVQIIQPRDFQEGDFDGDGEADDRRYTVVYAFSNARFLQSRILAVVYDYNGDGSIDRVELSVP